VKSNRKGKQGERRTEEEEEEEGEKIIIRTPSASY
jgi:hypothetical protein